MVGEYTRFHEIDAHFHSFYFEINLCRWYKQLGITSATGSKHGDCVLGTNEYVSIIIKKNKIDVE